MGSLNVNTLSSRNSGFALAELLLSMMIAASLFASIAFYLDAQRQDRITSEYGRWMAQYVNGVSAWMSAQGKKPPVGGVDPAGNTITPASICGGISNGAPGRFSCPGTDWLKAASCSASGRQSDDAQYLSCNLPENFNEPYGIGGSIGVSFDWETNPDAPTAEITFGNIETNGVRNVKLAAMLASEINTNLESDGYIHANAFIMDPTSTNVAELTTANLRARIDTSIEATVFVRRDGNTVTTGPLTSEHDGWTLIGRDSDGNENKEEQSATASANLNDVFVRANDAWISETHAMAEEAYRLAARSPQFMSEVAHNTTITKPTCPAPLTPQIFTYPVIFVGGSAVSDTRFIGGIRTPVSTAGPTDPDWKVELLILYEDSAGWQPVNSDMGRVSVTTRCG